MSENELATLLERAAADGSSSGGPAWGAFDVGAAWHEGRGRRRRATVGRVAAGVVALVVLVGAGVAIGSRADGGPDGVVAGSQPGGSDPRATSTTVPVWAVGRPPDADVARPADA